MNAKIITLVLIALCITLSANAQYPGYGTLGMHERENSQFFGGIGLTSIDSEGESALYYNIMLQPELAFGKLGIGLNINLNINTETGEIREKDWDENYDYLRLIRYLRWGVKSDPLYARLGTLDATRLGHGSIVNYYTNEASYDNRKIGLAFDMDFGTFGFETITSNFARAELVAARGYVRPLRQAMGIPVVKNITFGASFVRDFDPDETDKTDDGATVYGLDAELPILRTSFLTTYLYYDWAQIYGYSYTLDKARTFGNGQHAGLLFDFPALTSLFDFSFKFERRWLSKEYLPSYFDAFYEIQRYQNGFSKVDKLLEVKDNTKGWFGQLYFSALGNSLLATGTYSRLDDVDDSGIMHLAVDAPNTIPSIAAHATYDKMGIDQVKDVFTLDNKSVARVGVGYKLNAFLILYVDYIWTFSKEKDQAGNTYFAPQERVEPRIVFSHSF